MSARYLTPADVAALLKVSVRTVRRWVESGELAAIKSGAVIRITQQALTDWEAAHRTAAPTAPAAAPAVAAGSRPVALPVGWLALPADYEPVYPELAGRGVRATQAASPAAGRARGTRTRKSAG